jgi:hypothetical protein
MSTRVPPSDPRAERSPLGDAEQRRLLRTGGVEHCPHVGDAVIDGRARIERVRQPRAAFVEPDEPAERRQPIQEPGEKRLLPRQVQMRHEAGQEQDVDRPGPDNLVGDVGVTALDVLHLRSHTTSRRTRNRSCLVSEPEYMIHEVSSAESRG